MEFAWYAFDMCAWKEIEHFAVFDFFLSILQKTHVEVIPFVSHCPVSIEFISSEQKFETIIYANFKRSKYVVHI